MPVDVFISYSHRDDALYCELVKHLKPLEHEGVIQAWHDRRITAGQEFAAEINTALTNAKLVLLLVSPDFIHSDYCWSIEMKRAMERHAAREARVIPIILRPSAWENGPLGNLLALPKDGMPVTLWNNQDQALLNVAQGIRMVAREIGAPSIDTSPRPALQPEPFLKDAPPPAAGTPSYTYDIKLVRATEDKSSYPFWVYGTVLAVILLGFVIWLTVPKPSSAPPGPSSAGSLTAESPNYAPADKPENATNTQPRRPKHSTASSFSRRAPSSPIATSTSASDQQPSHAVPIVNSPSTPVSQQEPPRPILINTPKTTNAQAEVVSQIQAVHTLVVGLYGCNQEQSAIVCKMKVTRAGSINGTLDMRLPDWQTVLIDDGGASHQLLGSYVLDRSDIPRQQLPLGPGETTTLFQKSQASLIHPAQLYAYISVVTMHP
jgi:hypothetical protein